MDIFRPGGLDLTAKAAKYIGLNAGERVLDIGCGLGTSLCFLRDNYNIEPFGLELNPETAKRAALNLGVDRIYCGDACELPFLAEAFDAVFLECVLTLIDEPEKALAEAARVLVPGGHLVISSLEGAAKLLEDGRIGREALTGKLEELGFEILAVYDESAELRRFVAEIIFEYDSIESYIETANSELGGSVLSCDVPVKGTGYILVIARKKC